MPSTARHARTHFRKPAFVRTLMACAVAATVAACGGSVGDGPSGATPVADSLQAQPAPSPGATSNPGAALTPAPPVASAPAAAPASATAPIADPAAPAIPAAPAPGAPPPPPPPPSPPPPAIEPPKTSAKIDHIEWAQSLVYRSDDASLELVGGKRAVVFVYVTTDKPQEAKPDGDIRVFDAANGLVYQAALTLPTDALPATVPTEPGFSRAYSAVLPAKVVAPGMRLEVRLADGRPSASSIPPVGLGRALEIVAVPVRIAGVDTVIDVGLADAVPLIAPVASATTTIHAPYTSGAVTALPTTEADWRVAMTKILGEMSSLYLSEGADKNRQYVGYIPKRTAGVVGMGLLGGNSSVVADLPRYPGVVRIAALHELGHTFGLSHAPCGSPTNVDGNYPYANAALGAQGRFVWGFNADTSTFIDPRDSARHDLMSYCDGSTFSDYNYHKIQLLQRQVQAGAAEASQKPSLSGGPEELLLLSGTVSGDQLELSPPKAFEGSASPPRTGPYLLRLSSASGTWEYPFAVNAIDHDDARFIFAFSVPNPGPVQRLQILRNGQVLIDRSPAQRPATKIAGAEQKTTAPAVELREQGDSLRIDWDASVFAYLTITHVGVRRTTLAQDLQGGSATISMAGLAAGGSFEITLADGLNSTRIVRTR